MPKDKPNIIDYILSKYELSSSPQRGSSYILPSGEFLVLPDSHEELFNDIQDNIDIYEDDATELLSLAGWIRCNGSLQDMSYIELSSRLPTLEQCDAMKTFIIMLESKS